MQLLYFLFCVFFFKQKTAYEMRISDWSSDVCSSDLRWSRPPCRWIAFPAAVPWLWRLRQGQAYVKHVVEAGLPRASGTVLRTRSEEHTSELQSLMRISYAVFCLKKKNKKKMITHYTKTFVQSHDHVNKQENITTKSNR